MSQRQHVGTPGWLTLAPDERVVVRARPSKNALLATFVVGTVLLLAVGGLALAFDVPIPTARLLSTAVLVFVFVLTATVYLLTRRREYVVSTHGAYLAVGLTSPEVTSARLADVTDVAVVQSYWQRRLGVGEVRFDGDGGELLRFDYVEHPEWIRERVRETVDDSPRSRV